MTKITNVGVQPLVLQPGSVSFPPGVEVEVDNWAEVKKHPITKYYLDAGILSTEGPVEHEDDAEAVRKDDLVAQLKAFGAKADRRSGVDKLEAQLVAAQQRSSIVEALKSLAVDFDEKDSTEQLQEVLRKSNEPQEPASAPDQDDK